MGWNSWNNFGCAIGEALIHGVADAMATNGMKAAGYQFINLDDCWQIGRDTNGVIMADPVKFPSGMKALADYIHARGLKFGVYTDRGTQTCTGGGAGSYGYEYLDALTYAAWGVDYVKEDNCFVSLYSDPGTNYLNMSEALLKSGRPIVFSICYSPFVSWDPDLGNLWRTGGDIGDNFSSILTQLAYDTPPAFLAGPGHWNDPDMLEVGRGGMTTTEDRSHFTLWCIMAAPLLAGNDVTSMTSDTVSILTNAEVIAVDQDPAGEQGIPVAGSAAGQIWCKPLGVGFALKAVALLNTNSFPTNLTANWTDLGLQPGSASVRDLWAHADLGVFTNSFTTNVPAHGVVMLKISGTPPVLPISGTNFLSDLQPAYGYVGAGTVTKDKSIGGNPIKLTGVTYAKGIGAQSFSGFEYRLGAMASRFQADIGIDDEAGTNGSAVFQVYADGTKIYDSGILYGGGLHQTLNLDMTGVNRLTLGVLDGDDGITSDHADWAGARVIVSNTVPSPPAVPVGLVASPGNPIVLSWSTTPAAINYDVKRSGSFSGTYSNLASVATTGFRDSNVVSGLTYYYAVSAVDGIGESSNSIPVGVTACSVPGAPLSLKATNAGPQINLNWSPSSGATAYNVLRATVARPFAYLATGLTTTSFADTNVTEGMTYQYAVTAVNACNEGSPSAAVSASAAPLAPPGLTATPGNGAVVLNWSIPLPTVTYNIKRSTNAGASYVTIASNVSVLPYLDGGLANGTTYYYAISAVDDGGESPNSVPTIAEPCGGWPLGWTDQDIGSVGIVGGASPCSNSFIMQGGGADIWNAADAFNFASTSVSGDGCIVARVTAVDNTDQWAKGGVMFRGSSDPGSMFADLVVSPENGVNLQWRTVNGGGCDFTGIGTLFTSVWVRLARQGTNFTASYSTDGVSWSPIGSVSMTMPTNALAGLAVTAHNNSALCLAAFEDVAVAAPPVPSNLKATPGNTSVFLNWSPSPTAAAYSVKRSAISHGAYSVVGRTAGTSFAETNLVNGVTWYYVVSATNGVGESANSNEVAATPTSLPTLTVKASASQLTLTWPASAAGYNAYSATNLTPPVNWQMVTNTPFSNNGIFQLSLPPGIRKTILPTSRAVKMPSVWHY